MTTTNARTIHAETSTFTAYWEPNEPLSDFGLLSILREKHPPLYVVDILRPRGKDGLIQKAEWYLTDHRQDKLTNAPEGKTMTDIRQKAVKALNQRGHNLLNMADLKRTALIQQEVDRMNMRDARNELSGMPLTEAMIQQAEEVKDTRDDGYCAANVSEIAPGGYFKTSHRQTAKGLATEVVIDCEHATYIAAVVRWYQDGTRAVRFESYYKISRKEAEARIKDAVQDAIQEENDAVTRNEQNAGA